MVSISTILIPTSLSQVSVSTSFENRVLESDPIEIISNIPESGEARSIAIQGDIACVAHVWNGLWIYNISDPQRPLPLGHYFDGDWPHAVEVSGNHALAISWDDPIKIIDITNPHNLTKVGQIHTYSRIHDVAIQQDMAYIAAGRNGLVLSNISNPTEPQEIYQHSFGVLSDSYRVKVVNQTVYLMTESTLYIFDFSNLTQPTIIGSYRMADSYNSNDLGLLVKDTLVFVAAEENGVIILDVTNPENITQIGQIIEDVVNPKEIGLKDGICYVVDETRGLKAYNISNPNSSFQVGSTLPESSGSYLDIKIKDSLAYIAAQNRGLVIINITNPSNLVKVGNYADIGETEGIFVQENLCFVADGRGLLDIIDISNPLTPTKLYSSPKYGWGASAFVAEGYLFLAAGEEGLQILDVQDPTNPVLVGSIKDESSFRQVIVRGSYAYIAAGEEGIRIINISDLTSPQIVWSWTDSGAAYNLDIDGDYLYVADGQDGLEIYNIKNPALTREIGQYRGVSARDIVIHYPLAFVAAASSGLLILDVENPTQPINITQFQDRTTLPNFYVDIFLNESYVYVMDSNYDSLKIINISNLEDIRIIAKYKIWGSHSTKAVVVQGSYTFVGEGSHGVTILKTPISPPLDINSTYKPRKRGDISFGYLESIVGIIILGFWVKKHRTSRYIKKK
ncbi:MAG: LVIVD repeat-containing protein [Candidatus Hodarchaeales archaeon]